MIEKIKLIAKCQISFPRKVRWQVTKVRLVYLKTLFPGGKIGKKLENLSSVCSLSACRDD